MTEKSEYCKFHEHKVREIPIGDIRKMILKGIWKGSLEEEEILYNLRYNLYSEDYKSKVIKLIKLNDDAEKWVMDNLGCNALSFEETQMRKLAYIAGCEQTELEIRYAKNDYENGKVEGYMMAKTWHYVTDKLPPNPKENEDGISIQPLNYICAYECGDDDYECDEFMYLGNGEWNGENKDYPIYAWLDYPVNVPKPRKE